MGRKPKIIRSTLIFAMGLAASAAAAQDIDLTPRSPLEAIVLGDAEAANAHLTALAQRARTEREAVVAELLGAGFEPDRGTPACDFYGYYRRTADDGAARSVQIALCATGEPMVLVLDMLPPDRRGGGMGTVGNW